MFDPPADDVPSPCIGVCALSPANVCTGCGRHLDEIAAWPAASPAERRAIRDRAAQRRAILEAIQPESPRP